MILSPGGKTLQRVRMASSPRLELLPAGTGADRRTVTGDAFDIQFNPQGDLSEFAAQGNVRVVTEDTGPAPRQRVTTSDSLAAAFDPSTGTVERIRQWSRFRYQDSGRQAQADQADYAVREETIVLNGSPRVWNAQGRVEASRMRLGTQSGSLDAERNVSSTYLPIPSGGNSSAEPLHVVADRLEYESADDRAHYQGHARLWQGVGFLIEADSLELRRKEGELFAQDHVYTVFRRPTKSPSPQRTGFNSPTPAAGSFVIRSDTLLYRHKDRQAHYSGAVRLENEAGTVTAGELDIFFTSSSVAGPVDFSGGSDQIERAVAQTNVRILQGQRVASGDRAEYDPARGQLRLTGNLATITDPARGTTQGSQLTYLLGDDSIRVEGKPGLPTETRWSVHP
jgi:lipopolysaccharide export system protein LptA